MISRSRQTALITQMPTLAQRFGYTRSTETSLRCAARIHFHQHAPSFFRFVRELVEERRPSGIIDGLGEHARRQAFDVQIFDRDQTTALNYKTRGLVVKVSALVSDVRVRALQFKHGLLS